MWHPYRWNALTEYLHSHFGENIDFMLRAHVLRMCGYQPFQTTYGLGVPKPGVHKSRAPGRRGDYVLYGDA